MLGKHILNVLIFKKFFERRSTCFRGYFVEINVYNSFPSFNLSQVSFWRKNFNTQCILRDAK